MLKKIFILNLFLLLRFSLAAQSVQKKEHFVFINPNQEPTLNYEKAMVHADLDSLRFVNERRRIPVNGTTILIELLSAQELWDRYKKPISPLNIKDPLKCRRVKVTLAQAPYYLAVVPFSQKSDK